MTSTNNPSESSAVPTVASITARIFQPPQIEAKGDSPKHYRRTALLVFVVGPAIGGERAPVVRNEGRKMTYDHWKTTEPDQNENDEPPEDM